jgi:hypothetical protein
VRAAATKAAAAKAAKAAPEPIPAPDRVERLARREYVRLGDVEVNPIVQREFVQAKANDLAANFDPESLGAPVVNVRDGRAWVIDGQHRLAAMKIWLGEGWEDQHFEAEVYTDLTEAEEAEAFLKRNDAMSVTVYNKFRIAVVAGREDEQTVAGIVLRQNLTISRDRDAEGRIIAVGTLLRIYRRAGGDVLSRTLAIIRDAYGTPGLEAAVLSGVSLVVHRYDNLNDKEIVARLAHASGGVGALLAKAERARKETGNPKNFCVAGAIVDTYNSLSAESKGGNGTKLLSWWRAAAAQ